MRGRILDPTWLLFIRVKGGSVNLGPVLQHESRRAVRFYDLPGWPSVSREGYFEGLAYWVSATQTSFPVGDLPGE